MHDYSQVKFIQSRVGDTARKEVTKLRQELLKLTPRMRETLETLVEWQLQRSRYSKYMSMADDEGTLHNLACLRKSMLVKGV